MSFTVPNNNGSSIVSYTVTAADETNQANGGEIATGASSPIVVGGLTNGDVDNFTVTATNSVGTGPPSAPSPNVTITATPMLEGTGSYFAGPALQTWAGETGLIDGLDVNFETSNSVTGMSDFATSEVDFGASDLPYSAGESPYQPVVPYQYLPDVAAGLGLMYNLTNPATGQRITDLDLTAKDIADIFLGIDTRWDQLGAHNPELVGISTPIDAIYRTDASGENYLLSDYLLHEDEKPFVAAQKAFHVSSSSVGQPSGIWPTPLCISEGGCTPSQLPEYPGWTAGSGLVGENGPDQATNAVASTDGSISYAAVAYASAESLPLASVKNGSGSFVQPTTTAVSTALEAASLNADFTENLSGVYTDKQAGAYPLPFLSYLITACSPSLASGQGTTCDGPDETSTYPDAKGQELGEFVNYLACAGQASMGIGYAPLPPNLVQQDFNAIGRLNGGVEPPPPTASNCPDPTISG